MNYNKYKQEERDFIRYWNLHDVVKEEKTIETQTKHLKRIDHWAKKVQDRFNENEHSLLRLDHRNSRILNIDYSHYNFDDCDWDPHLSWKEYEHLTQELDAAGMTEKELEDCLPYFGLHLFDSYFWNAPYNTRYRRNKKTFIFNYKYVITTKDRKLINRLFEEAYEDSLHFTSKYKKTRTLRLAEMVQGYIWECDRFSDEEEKLRMKLAECISSDEDKVFVDTEYRYAANRKLAEDLEESLTIPSGTIIEICKKSTRFDIPPSMLNWNIYPNTGTKYIQFPFKEDFFINGKMEKMKSFSLLLFDSLKHLLPYIYLYEFAPEGVIFDLRLELIVNGVMCKLFVPYDRLRTTIPQLCDIKWSLVSWFKFISSFHTYYHQHYLLVSNEAKRYFDVAWITDTDNSDII